MCINFQTFKGRRIRYYASNVSAWARRRKLKRMRADGDGLEQLIVASLKTMLLDREQLRQILLNHGIHGPELDRLTRAGSAAARRFDNLPAQRRGDVLRGILERVELTPHQVTMLVLTEELRRFLAWDGVGIFGVDIDGRRRNPSIHFLRANASVVRARNLFALPLVAAPQSDCKEPDKKLLRLLNDASNAQRLLYERRDLDLPGLAALFGCKMDRFSRLVRLNYLAPDIALAIRDGSQPAAMTRRSLLAANLPLDWATQRNLLGFSPQPEHFRNPNASPPSRMIGSV
jgi:hypothetical protein